MNDEFIGKHGIRLDLVARTSVNEILNIVLSKQVDSLQKVKCKKNDALRKQTVAYPTDLDSFVPNC